MRLIDAEALIDDLNQDRFQSPVTRGAVSFLTSVLHSRETIDPVTHGFWQIHEDDYYAPYSTCSCCKNDMVLMNEHQLDDLPKFCWECGAKMDLPVTRVGDSVEDDEDE